MTLAGVGLGCIAIAVLSYVLHDVTLKARGIDPQTLPRRTAEAGYVFMGLCGIASIVADVVAGNLPGEMQTANLPGFAGAILGAGVLARAYWSLRRNEALGVRHLAYPALLWGLTIASVLLWPEDAPRTVDASGMLVAGVALTLIAVLIAVVRRRGASASQDA